jgi:2-iminoacetate synthase
VLFAPLYISNRCANECTYCAFRATNATLKRRTLTQEEIAEETRILIRQGHKRVLMVSGEGAAAEGFQYILDSIATIYNTHVGPGEIRRVNVNLAPQTTERFGSSSKRRSEPFSSSRRPIIAPRMRRST